MAKGKAKNTQVAEVKPEPKQEPNRPAKSGFKSRYEEVAFRYITDRHGEGTRGFLTKPVYVPPDIEIAWALAPSIDDGEDVTRRIRDGFDFVPRDMVTEDVDEAIREGKIAFVGVTISNMTEIGDTGGVGLGSYGIVLMARSKEMGERIRQAYAERFKQKIASVSGELDGMHSSIKSERKKIEIT